LLRLWWRKTASMSWSPIFFKGLRAEMGSWKTMAISRLRICASPSLLSKEVFAFPEDLPPGDLPGVGINP